MEADRRNRQHSDELQQFACPVCDEVTEPNLGDHIRKRHGEKAFRKAVLAAKEQGLTDAQIGARYGISFNALQQIITEAYGANISVLKQPKRINQWEPPNFVEETTTVWSFKQRGRWATHDGRYRGNWSPYIPRNVILKYSEPGDVVLDYFVGGGTTAIEAKLLGRRCIARDINPAAVSITLENLRFTKPRELFGENTPAVYEPEVSVGDARELLDIPDGAVDLICAHPPYAGIISYSADISGDLSALSLPDFLAEMRRVALQSFRVLKPGGKCAILVGDARKYKHVVPIGFQTIRAFLDAGFRLRELVIKRQHNCKTTGFWYTRSIEHNFLLLAHEYLPIFEKPEPNRVSEGRSPWQHTIPYRSIATRVIVGAQEVETTTVWIFPRERLDAELRRNLVKRFGTPDTPFLQFTVGDDGDVVLPANAKPSLVYVAPPENLTGAEAVAAHVETVGKIATRIGQVLPPGSFFVVDTRDLRIGETLWPTGLLTWERLSGQEDLAIKEIIVVVPEEETQEVPGEYLHVTHRYLLVWLKQSPPSGRGAAG